MGTDARKRVDLDHPSTGAPEPPEQFRLLSDHEVAKLRRKGYEQPRLRKP